MTQDNKNYNDVNDELISNAVQSVRFSLPEDLDRRVKAAMFDEERAGLRKQKAPPLRWLPATAAAMILIVLALFLFQPFSHTPNGKNGDKEISEIKTELELAHANIKIIWVQKKDFKLNRGSNP